jgi:heat shock protein HslJ
MKKILILLFLILTYGWSCEKGKMTDYDLLDRDWSLSYIQDIRTSQKTDFPSDADREISLYFDGESNAMYFTGICNFGAGIYEFTSSQGEILISGIVTTNMGCSYVEWEAIATRNLQNNSGFKITGNSLVIYSADTHNLYFLSK